MGKSKPIRSTAPLAPRAGTPAALRRRAAAHRDVRNPKKNSNVILSARGPAGLEARTRSVRARMLFGVKGATAPESKDLAATTQGRGTQMLALILSVLLAMTMLPAAGLQGASAYADEPVERPATSGGDVALQDANGAVEAQAPIAQTREDGMLVADGLVYTVADGGLSLVGFDFAEDAKAVMVPAAIGVDGKATSVVAIDLAEGSVAEGVTALTIPQSIKNIRIETLASALPSLLSVEVAAGQGSTLPAAAGAAAMRATYSSFGGSLLGQATVDVEGDGGSVEAVQCRELLWAPPAAVAVRLPVDCLSIAPGALADAENLETIVCFGDVQRIAAAERDEAGNVTSEGALTDGQLEAVTVVFPDATPAVPADADERVSASMALNDGATQTDKRHAWIALGLPLERLSMGKPTGALTETVAVGDDGTIAKTDLQLVSYPGMHPQATDVKHPGEDGTIDMAESGLAFTVKSDMTASVAWQGDKTATPAHIDIPSSVVIDGVTYPVTEIAAGAFEGAAFLKSVAISEDVTSIGDAAFANCANLSEATFPATLKFAAASVFDGTQVDPPALVFRTPAAAQSGVADAVPDSQGVQRDIASAAEGDESASLDDDGALRDSDGEQFPPNEDLMASPDNSISSFSYHSSAKTAYIYAFVRSDELIGSSIQGSHSYMTASPQDNDSLKFEYIGQETPDYWSCCVTQSKSVFLEAYSASGSRIGYYNFKYKNTEYVPISVSASKSSLGFYVCFVRPEVVGQEPLATADLLSKSGETAFTSSSTVRGALNDLSGLLSKPGEQSFSSTSTVRTNIIQLNAKFSGPGEKAFTSTNTVRSAVDAKVDASDFGTITYSGLDGSDMSVYPTSYRKGGTPALPKPEKPGSRFAGWTWSGHATPTTDPNEIKTAFADGNKTVTLTANWTAPEATYFFTEDKPLDPTATSTQEHEIFVKLSDSPGTLKSFNLKCDNSLGLFQIANLESNYWLLRGSKEGGWKSFRYNRDCVYSEPLGQYQDGFGVYVLVTIPSNALNPSAFPSSLVSGSSVLECFEFEYELA